MRSLKADNLRRSTWGVVLVAALLAAWAAWFFLARVPLYEVTDTARLEVDQEAHPVEAPVAGRIVTTRLVLGQRVQAGDVLVELDAEPQRLELEQEQIRRSGLDPQIHSLRDEVSAEEKALRQARQASSVALDEARARLREAEASTHLAEDEAGRQARMYSEGLVAEIDNVRAKAEAEKQRAAADSLKLTVSRLEEEQRTRETDRQAQIEQLRHDINELEADKATATANIARLEHEVERRRITAPVAGRLGEIASLRVGGYVREGDKVAAVVPPGKLKVVATFPPPAALGRVRPGQRARLRLEGFPWAQYGSIPATVSSVASEVREGRIRVDLLVDLDPLSRIPLQHGLPGTVEVEIERVTPAALTLRVAGQLLAAPRTSAGAAGGGQVSR